MQEQINWILALQNAQALAGVMEIFTWLGNEEFFLLIIPLVYLCIDHRIGARLGLLVLLCDTLAFFCKLAFHLPRPYWLDPRVRMVEDTSYGLPSSHAQVGTAVWFYFARLIRQPWMWVVAAIIVLLISISRVYLGVHFPSDILGGWVIGALFLLLFLRFEPPLSDRLRALSLGPQILVAFVVAIGLLLAGVLLRALLAGAPGPATWAMYTKGESRHLDALANRTGALFGLGAGVALAARYAPFSAGGPHMLRVVRFVLGVVGLLLLWQGLAAVFPKQPESVGLFFRFVRYGLMTFWVAFVAPWLFLKLKLAQPRQADAASVAA